MFRKSIYLIFALLCLPALGADENKLRIFTWDGYVMPNEIAAVNKLLEAAGNPVRAELVPKWAEGPDQMHSVIASGAADLSFLTLNYIKMQNGRTAKLLQGINTTSPRLPNYKKTIEALRDIPYGMVDGKHLYVPWGGGAYGLWANMKKVKKEDLPKSLSDLLDPKWKGKISLTKGQVQPNVALAMMAIGKQPFELDLLVQAGKKAEAKKLGDPNGEAQKFLNALYNQVKTFWGAVPDFGGDLEIVASYGIEIQGLLDKGEDWQLIQFKEGTTVWLDTMNVMASVTGKKLEAAEIFMNYFLGPEVQNRVVKGLSMVAASKEVNNPMLKTNPDFFAQHLFWPPYAAEADNVMKQMSSRAMLSATQKKK